MRWNYVSELCPPADLLFNPHVIRKHWEPWWNDIDMETPESYNRDLLQSYQQSHLVVKQEELAKGIMNFTLRSIFLHISKDSLTCRKILGHEADGFTSFLK
jgi:hypothetical protein